MDPIKFNMDYQASAQGHRYIASWAGSWGQITRFDSGWQPTQAAAWNAIGTPLGIALSGVAARRNAPAADLDA